MTVFYVVITLLGIFLAFIDYKNYSRTKQSRYLFMASLMIICSAINGIVAYTL